MSEDSKTHTIKSPNARKKWALWLQDPSCHWCGRFTVPFLKPQKPRLDCEATLDHVYHKFDSRRGNAENQVVLACNKCNEERGRADWARLRDSRMENNDKNETV